jgi:hypothetical protein
MSTDNKKWLVRGCAIAAILMAAPLTLSRASGVTFNDAQCSGLTTCCGQSGSFCCTADTEACLANYYDRGVGAC